MEMDNENKERGDQENGGTNKCLSHLIKLWCWVFRWVLSRVLGGCATLTREKHHIVRVGYTTGDIDPIKWVSL
jgi:hypothetical protein